MDPFAQPVVGAQALKTSRIAGPLHRLGSLAIDGLVLGAIGFALGSLLGERRAPVGTPARLIGLLVMLPYFGLLGSEIGNGQTVGKKLLRLRVLDENGRPLPLGRSLVRAALLSLPWIFNGMRFGSAGPVVLATLWVEGVLVFGVGGAIVATFLLNGRTRQALHDLVVGSYVVHADGIGLRAPAASTRRPLVASKVWIVLVAVGTLAMAFAARRFLAPAFPPALLESILAIPGASSVEIRQITTTRESRSPLVTVLWFRGPEGETERAAQEVVSAILQHHPDADAVPTISVKVIRGWDVGVASMIRSQTFVKTPTEWRDELLRRSGRRRLSFRRRSRPAPSSARRSPRRRGALRAAAPST